ncbi:MAG TPA: SseB family protein [Candidatus Nanopelagicales bacterium]|nr:SseB family protein [Candidatus Nanopelagicales bacterium]
MDLEHGAAEQQRPGAPRFGGMTVPDPEFAGDDGSSVPAVAAALAAYDQGSAGDAELLAVLAGSRVMVPLVAVLDSLDEQVAAPGPGEKDSHLASVSMVAPDGRRGLLAFTSVDAMAAWDPAARGIPSRIEKVAAAALEEGADAVLLDVGGPVRHALVGVPLTALAHGVALPEPYDDPEVRAAVVAVLESVPGVVRADLRPPGAEPAAVDADLVLLVEPDPTLDPAAVGQVLARALAAEALLARRCPRGVAVGVVPPPA